MAVFYNEKEECYESFVWKPRKPSCLNEDGSCDYNKLNGLLFQAQMGNHVAQMLVFEQYQYLWGSEITMFVANMLSYEDAQQEAFLTFLLAIKTYKCKDADVFGGYFRSALHINLVKLAGKERDGQKETLFSLDEMDEEGNRIHDFADPSADCFDDPYYRIKKRLSKIEFKVAYLRYEVGLSLKKIAQILEISYIYVRVLNANLKKKLKDLY